VDVDDAAYVFKTNCPWDDNGQLHWALRHFYWNTGPQDRAKYLALSVYLNSFLVRIL
jgi:hypothetical protein